jgi:Cytochrome bd terminal oxidase subunit I
VIASSRRRFVQRVRRCARAFALEAAFFGVLMFGGNKVPRWFYLMSCFMVAAGASLSSWSAISGQCVRRPAMSELFHTTD